jgi:hypothetical protein
VAIEILCLVVCAANLGCLLWLMRRARVDRVKQQMLYEIQQGWDRDAVKRHYRAMDLLEPMQEKLNATAKHLGVRNGKYVYVEEPNGD